MLTRRRETDLSQRDQIDFTYAGLASTTTLRLSFYLLVLTAYSRLGKYILWPCTTVPSALRTYALLRRLCAVVCITLH